MLRPFPLAEVHIPDRNSLRASKPQRCDHLVVLTYGVAIRLGADDGFQLNEPPEAGDLVQVDACVPKYQQMTCLFNNIGARQRALENVSKGRRT